MYVWLDKPHGYKVKRKVSNNPVSSHSSSFVCADIGSFNLVGAAHTSHPTVWVVTEQTSCHVDVMSLIVTGYFFVQFYDSSLVEFSVSGG